MTASSAADSRPLIAHVIVNLDVGGLENGVVNLVNRIPADRYRQAIVCLKSYTDFRKRIARDDVEVVALGKREGKDLGNYVKLWRLFRSLRPTIVHTRNIGTIDVALAAKLAGVPHVVHGEHGWDVADEHGNNKKYRWFRKAFRPLIDRQIAVSRHIASWLTATVGIAPRTVTQIYNGVDTAKFHPAGERRAAAGPEDFAPPHTFVIGTVGRLAAIKDPVTLARAFRRVLDANGPERVRLAIVGDGPLYEDVKQVLAGDDARRVTWLAGKRDDVAELMRGFDLFVLPSRNEGISNTILEAMASGLPVVATHVGGNAELVAPGTTGALVPPQAPDAMAAAIQRYLDDPALARRHGAAGRERVLRDFSMDRMLEAYLEVYDSLGYPREQVHGD